MPPVNEKVSRRKSFRLPVSLTEFGRFAADFSLLASGTDTKRDETLYNQYLVQKLQGTCVHPHLKGVDPNEPGNYPFEPADIYVGEKLLYVKIGDSSDFAYAIDQVELVLDVLRRDLNTITMVDGMVIQPTTLALILVFKDRRTLVEEWKDIKSINFLLHLARLKRKISDSFVSLEVHFMYNNKRIQMKFGVAPLSLRHSV